MNPIAILSDIKQAFLQIEIDPEHRDFLRFFWFDNPCDPFSKIVTYHYLRVVFGLTSLPFILNATVRHHLNKFSENESEFVKKFLEDLYVDDSSSGCESVSEGKEFYEKCMSVSSSGGFHLRKWVTNSKELQGFFDDKEEKEAQETMKKFLRVLWDVESDEFVFSFVDILKMAKNL